MKTAKLSPQQQQRFEKVLNLAQTRRNLTLTLVEPHQNPYRDLSSSHIVRLEETIKRTFINALPDGRVSVLVSADENVRSAVSFGFAEQGQSRGSVLRLVATDKRWFEENWMLFAGDFGFGARRSVFVFLEFNEKSLSGLVAPWWDPDVLLNPHIASSRTLLKEVELQIQPSTIVFSLALVRLRSCQLYFHSQDVDLVTRTVCAAARKTKWWK